MKRPVLVVLAVLAVSCTQRPSATPPRADPPRVGPPAPFTPPRAGQIHLDNGVRLIVVENHRLPIVAITAVHSGAGGRADSANPGTAALTADLLDEGAGTRNADELAEALERAAARIDIYVASDYASLQLVTTAEHTEATIALVADMIRRPRFADSDIERVRTRRIADMQDRRTRPRTVAAQLFDRIVFGSHWYATPAEGTLAGLAATTPALVRTFWQSAYHPTGMTLIVAGDVDPARLRRTVEHAFGDWHDAGTPLLMGRAAATTPQLAYVDSPGAAQSVVVMGRRTTGTKDPQRLAADLANAILGGGPGSRLDAELHDRLGITVGAGTSFWRGERGGTWTLAATFPTDATATGIRAALAVIEKARTTDVSADELARAKINLMRATAQSFDSMAGTARAFERVVVQGLPLTWYPDLTGALAAIDIVAVREVARTRWSELVIVVVGDWAKIGPGLTALGLPVVQHNAQ